MPLLWHDGLHQSRARSRYLSSFTVECWFNDTWARPTGRWEPSTAPGHSERVAVIEVWLHDLGIQDFTF